MKAVPQYTFFRTKYGVELQVDVVELKRVKRYLMENLAHTLTYYDLTFITEGKGAFHINHKEYQVGLHDIIFSIPGEIRNWDINHIENGYALIFEEEFLLSFFNDPDFIRNLSYFLPEAERSMSLDDEVIPRISSLLKTIQEEIKAYPIQNSHILRALLYEMLMLIEREYKKDLPTLLPLPGTIHAFRRHMERFTALLNHEFSSHHDVAYYADKLCLTSGYLNEVIKHVSGVSAKKYIRQKLLHEARKLLKYTSLSVVEISDRMNFSTVSYFIRFFRQCEGVTPLQYRNQSE